MSVVDRIGILAPCPARTSGRLLELVTSALLGLVLGVRFMVCLFGFQLGSYQEKMLSWGRALSGQLGLGGIEEEFVSTPMRSKHLGSHRVLQVATGLQHTLILLDNGCVLSCGKNESGQLGQDKSCLRPGVCVCVSI